MGQAHRLGKVRIEHVGEVETLRSAFHNCKGIEGISSKLIRLRKISSLIERKDIAVSVAPKGLDDLPCDLEVLRAHPLGLDGPVLRSENELLR